MDFRLADELQDIKEMARDFAQSELAPHAARWDQEGSIDMSTRPEEENLVAWLRSQEISGDLTYASPEQVRGEPLDQRSLVFSVGVLLFERLTGRHPFGVDHNKRVARLRQAKLASGVNYFPKIPAELRAVVVKAIAAYAGRSIWNRPTSSATICWASAALPPLPQTMSFPPPVQADETAVAKVLIAVR